MKRMILLAAGALAACTPSTTPTTSKYEQTQQTVTPKGSIIGRVLDGATWQGLDGASVKVIGLTTPMATPLTTDADGAFVFTDAVVNSSYTFVIEKSGFLRQTVATQIQGSAGNSPLAGSITTFTTQLYHSDGEVRGYVFLPDNKPATNATVVVDQRSSGAGDSVVTVQTGMDGAFRLTGLASRPTGFSHVIYALWYDENGDGNADYPTTNVNVSVFPGSSARTFITYPNNGVGLRIVSTNIFDAQLPPNTDIDFTFSVPVLPQNLTGGAPARTFLLTNTTRGGQEVAVDITWTSPVQASVHPTVALAQGERYRISLSLTPVSASNSGNAAPSFSPTLDFQLRPDNAGPFTTQVRNLSVYNPNFSATVQPNQYNWNTNSFQLTWDGVQGAVAYWVYAKDTKQNPDWVFIQTNNSLTPRVSVATSLPGSFDVNPGDGTNQPLSFGNTVTFAVVPLDIYGNLAPVAQAPTVQVSDNIAPTTTRIDLLTPNGPSGAIDAINDDTVPSTIQFRVTYSEPMDPTTAPSFLSAGAFTQAFAWDSFNSGGSGVLTITIAPSADASGPFIIRGGKDYAGNALINNDFSGSLTGRKELLRNGAFEDSTGACSVMLGWNPTQTSSMPSPAAVAGAGKLGKCAALLGAPPGGAPQAGSSKITQDITLPSMAVGSNWSFEARVATRPIYLPPPVGAPAVTQQCRITDTADVTQVALVANTNGNQTSYSTTTVGGILGALGGMTVRFNCEVNNPSAPNPANAAMYVDDASLSLVKPGSGTDTAGRAY